MSEIARKRAYVRRSCPKGTTKAADRAFCRTRLLVTPTLIDVFNMHDMSTRCSLLVHTFKGCQSSLFMLELEIQRRKER